MECCEDAHKANRAMRIGRQMQVVDEFATNPGINLVVKLRFSIDEAEAEGLDRSRIESGSGKSSRYGR